jgi:hypothetical protein
LWLYSLSEARDAKASRFASQEKLVIGTGTCHSPFLVARFRASSTCAAAMVNMFHDLNIPWTDATRELQRTVAFLDECECTCSPLHGFRACSRAQQLTQCSRIRRYCTHSHLFGEAARRPGTSRRHDPQAIAVLSVWRFNCCFTCAFRRHSGH